MENNQPDSFLQMHLDYDSGNLLRETVRWSRFLAIVGIIFLSFFLLVFVLGFSQVIASLSQLNLAMAGLASLGTALIIGIFAVGFAILGYTVYMLYRFSTLTRRGIEQQDQAVFSEGMRCLKVYFIFGAIFSFIGLLFNILSLANFFR